MAKKNMIRREGSHEDNVVKEDRKRQLQEKTSGRPKKRRMRRGANDIEITRGG